MRTDGVVELPPVFDQSPCPSQRDPDPVQHAVLRHFDDIFGHIGNWLATALWRDAVSLLIEGVASIEDVDAAVVEGPGRKWTITEAFESYHLSGGRSGTRRFLENFAEGIQRRRDDLGAPKLDAATQACIVALVEAGMAGASVDEWESHHAALLVDLMLTLGSQKDITTER